MNGTRHQSVFCTGLFVLIREFARVRRRRSNFIDRLRQLITSPHWNLLILLGGGIITVIINPKAMNSHSSSSSSSSPSSSSSSLITSAEELLKTRSIPELRELVKTLEHDAVSKVSELQFMVGSKYNDFIQSADAIASMQQKSEFLERQLTEIVKLSSDVAAKTHDLLSRTVEDKSESKHNQRLLFASAKKGVDSSAVWTYLEDCDIYGAATVVVQAKVLLHAAAQAQAQTHSSQRSATPDFCRLLKPELMTSLASSSIPSHADLIMGCASASFLDQTVLDDAHLLMLEGGCSPEEKARTLAALGLVGAATASAAAPGLPAPSLHRGELLQRYLEAADVLLDAAVGGDQTAVSQTQQGQGQGQGPTKVTGKGGSTTHAPSMADRLVAAVRVLQQTILDAHVLFFRPAPIPEPSCSAPSSSASSAVAAPAIVGLVALYQAEFVEDVSRALAALAAAASHGTAAAVASTPRSPRPDSAAAAALAADRAAFVAAERVRCPPTEVRRAFDEWLARAVQRLGSWSQAALQAMGSAVDVARLQQRVWLSSTTVPTAGSQLQGQPQPLQQTQQLQQQYSQRDWEEACAELLAAKRRRPSALTTSAPAHEADHSSSVPSASTLLWSRVFRSPFLLQVERLLRESCAEVLGGARTLLLHALAAEGVLLDPASLAAQTHAQQAQAQAAARAGAGGSGSGFTLAHSIAPSPRLFRRAEMVRQFLQEEVSDLLRDVVLPVQEGDPESSQGLSRALFIQCAQLTGHVAVLLRCVLASLLAALDTAAASAKKSARQAQGTAAAEAASAAMALSVGPLLSGVLLVGRVAWLLKIRGRFVEEALAAPGARSASSTSSSAAAAAASLQAAHGYELVSEDQMRSAFEIADTNGDGVLTYSEAVEAIQALAVADSDSFGSATNKSSSSSSSAIPFLSPRLTPSLTYAEFALLCAHLSAGSSSADGDGCLPVGRFAGCLDRLLATAHRAFAERVVATLEPALGAALDADFLPSSPLSSSSPFSSASTLDSHKESRSCGSSFKAAWRLEWVELDADGEGEGATREQVALPTAVSHGLNAFLFAAAGVAASSLLSVDTVQELPARDVFPRPFQLAPQGAGDFSSEEKDGDRDGGGADKDKEGDNNRCALTAASLLFSRALLAAADQYGALLNTSAARGEDESTTSSATSGGASDEDVAMQAVFDCLALDALCKSCGLAPTPKPLRVALAGWRARMDPINAEILAPLITRAALRFVAHAQLLLPCLKPPPLPSQSAKPTDGPPSAAAASSEAEVAAATMASIFPQAPTARFALLPLPMSTQYQGASWADRDRDGDRAKARFRSGGSGAVGGKLKEAAERDRDDDDYLGAIPGGLSSGMTASMAKTLLGGQQSAENLGKYISSSFGNFLGGNQQK